MVPQSADKGPGPVHVLAASKYWHYDRVFTACYLDSLDNKGLLYNSVGGPTDCPACLEALALEVEDVLR